MARTRFPPPSAPPAPPRPAPLPRPPSCTAALAAPLAPRRPRHARPPRRPAPRRSFSARAACPPPFGPPRPWLPGVRGDGSRDGSQEERRAGVELSRWRGVGRAYPLPVDLLGGVHRGPLIAHRSPCLLLGRPRVLSALTLRLLLLLKPLRRRQLVQKRLVPERWRGGDWESVSLCAAASGRAPLAVLELLLELRCVRLDLRNLPVQVPDLDHLVCLGLGLRLRLFDGRHRLCVVVLEELVEAQRVLL